MKNLLDILEEEIKMKAKFLGTNGHEWQLKEAINMGLITDNMYEIDDLYIGGCSSRVYLVGFYDNSIGYCDSKTNEDLYSFNTVMFDFYDDEGCEIDIYDEFYEKPYKEDSYELILDSRTISIRYISKDEIHFLDPYIYIKVKEDDTKDGNYKYTYFKQSESLTLEFTTIMLESLKIDFETFEGDYLKKHNFEKYEQLERLIYMSRDSIDRLK